MDKLKALTDTFEKLQPTGETFQFTIPRRKGDIPVENEVLPVKVSMNGNDLEIPVTLEAVMKALELFNEEREEMFSSAKATLEEIDSVIAVT